MGRPRKGSTNSKQLPVIEEEKEEGENNVGSEGKSIPKMSDDTDEEYEEEVEEEDEDFDDEENAVAEELDIEDLAPPVLEPCEPPERPKREEQPPQQPPNPFANLTSAFGAPSARSSTSGLLKPPKLTASLSPPGAGKSSGGSDVTNLSTISARFMKGKSNPFANLMKLASGPESSRASSKHEDDDDDGDNEETDDDNEDEDQLNGGGGGSHEAAKPSSASEDE